ncbi:peptidoglycan-binding domain-containing protein [Ekhidna sp.]|uniref:peptidoglycan-binding domain-containing protein n=1 Tax=Ekhidna sp. TaxID=2608089 RepID=UPI003CCC15BC
MANEDPNITVARFNFKQAIIVAAITGITTLGGTLLTLKSGNNNTDSTPPDREQELVKCKEENDQLRTTLSQSISFTSLSDISNNHFNQSLDKEEVKSVIRKLVAASDRYENDSKHYMHKLFRLKKLMLSNGGNINVRVSSANQEACKLIQDLLKGIEYYRGTVDGNVESTREAVERFQNTLNNYTPGYFEEKNIGIVGKKTFNAILEHYERS